MRTAEIKRKTRETDIEVFVDLDGSGKIEIADAVLLRRYLHGLSDEKTADTE